METISQELLDVKNAFDNKIDSLKTECNDLVTKIKTLSDACTSTKSKMSSVYKSQNTELVLSSFDTLAKTYDSLESSVTSTIGGTISGVEKLLPQITKLIELQTTIEDIQKSINNTPSFGDEAFQRKRNLEINRDKKIKEFKELHTLALSALNALKGVSSIDTPISAATETNFINGDVVVEGGTFQKQSFTASNKVNVTYYLYVPKLSNNSGKVPILTYIHGIQDTVERNENNNFKYGGGLAGLIERGISHPKGIVIFPQATNGTVDKDFLTKPYQDALIELIKSTAEKYNGDLNRLSIAGHSNGGAAAQHMVNNYPGFFAATALMGISSNAKEGIAKTHLYALVGSKDHTIDSYGRAIGYAQKHNQMYKVYNMGHDIQTIAFEEPVEDENGNPIMLVDWLMSKTLNE